MYRFGFCLIAFVSLAIGGEALWASQQDSQMSYRERMEMFFKLDPKARKVPKIPPKGERIRVIIDSDAKNEIDDIWAISLAILSSERFKIEGFVAANFDNPKGGPEGVEASAKEIETILEKAGMAGRWPIKRGSHPMRYQYAPSRSEGVDFIIERAMAGTPENPLWVVGLGASTDIASAVLIEPRIIDRIVVFWHFRTKWPKQCHNFNVFNDPRAARIVFHSPLSFVLFDTGTYLRCPMKESERFVSCGELGRYLHEYRYRSSYYQRSNKGFFDVGDIVALVEPDLASWEVTACPDVEKNLDYKFRGTKGQILRCYDIDRDRTFELFYNKLRAHVSGR
jgi:inosine-uridine nucleoside N-ribohydrolase